MAFKAMLAFSASVLLVQSALGQCLGRIASPCGYATNGLAGAGLAGSYGAGYGCGGVASTGGGLPVSSASPIAPVGVSVVSENAYEGTLAAGGNLPFLGTVGIEGVLPTAGAGAVSYGCGNGAVEIASEGPIATGILAPGDFAPAAGLAASGIAGLGAVNGLGIGGINGLGLGGINGLGLGGINGLGLGGITGYGLGGIVGNGLGQGCGCCAY